MTKTATDWKRTTIQVLGFLGPFLGFLFVFATFCILARSTFWDLYNLKTILTQTVIIGIGALGMTLVIISAGIDLSAGSVIALGTVVTAAVIRDLGRPGEIGFFLPLGAALIGILVCGLCGFCNGLMISGLRIVPFIVTLGMMQIVRGVAKWIGKETMVNTHSSWLNKLMVVEPLVDGPEGPQPDVWYSIAPGVWIMVGLLGFMFVVLRFTAFGRYVYAVGSNEATARLCGIRVGLQRVWIYTICGLLTGVAGIMQFANLGLGDPTAAVGMELDIIAAVVIGGGSLSGGEGSVVGSVIGALTIATLRNGCVLCEIPNYVQNIVIGAIIIVAVGLDRFKHRREA